MRSKCAFMTIKSNAEESMIMRADGPTLANAAIASYSLETMRNSRMATTDHSSI